jgi:regulator of sirC expression with transglutaminase-like and TPR domain
MVERLLDLLTGRDDSLDLDRAALELARIQYPDLDPEPFLALLDSYAFELSHRLPESSNGAAYVSAANRYLLGDLGLTGNSQNYYDPRNSCLNDVLTARTGIPITLAVVYLEIARRLAKPVYGIGLPGHFLVEYRDSETSLYVDLFHAGRTLTSGQCYDLARHAVGPQAKNDPGWLEPVGKRHILIRMLNNLSGVYFRRQSWAKALAVLNLLLAAEPAADYYKQRAIAHIKLCNHAAARADLESYLRFAPQATDRGEIETHLREVRHYLARLN